MDVKEYMKLEELFKLEDYNILFEDRFFNNKINVFAKNKYFSNLDILEPFLNLYSKSVGLFFILYDILIECLDNLIFLYFRGEFNGTLSDSHLTEIIGNKEYYDELSSKKYKLSKRTIDNKKLRQKLSISKLKWIIYDNFIAFKEETANYWSYTFGPNAKKLYKTIFDKNEYSNHAFTYLKEKFEYLNIHDNFKEIYNFRNKLTHETSTFSIYVANWIQTILDILGKLILIHEKMFWYMRLFDAEINEMSSDEITYMYSKPMLIWVPIYNDLQSEFIIRLTNVGKEIN